MPKFLHSTKAELKYSIRCLNAAAVGSAGTCFLSDTGACKAISLFFAIGLYRLACTANISHEVKSHMRWHTTVNFVIGLIPIVGLIFDIFYQANAKNLRILEQFLYNRARTNSAQPLDANAAPSKHVSIEPTLV